MRLSQLKGCYRKLSQISMFAAILISTNALSNDIYCRTSDFGPEDELGRANYLSKSKVVQAGKLIGDGTVYELGRIHDEAVFTPFPTRFFEFHLVPPSGLIAGGQVGTAIFNESFTEGTLGQWASQWDGLSHFGNDRNPDGDPDKCYYNNFTQEQVYSPEGVNKLGAEGVPPFVTRGILLDIAKLNGMERLPPNYVISDQEIAQALKEQAGIRLTKKRDLQGDVVLIRTGVDQFFEDDPTLQGNAPGIGIFAAELLSSEGVVMVGADNFAVEVWPRADDKFFPVHQLFLIREGIYIMENLDLQELSENNVHKFFFTLIVNKWRGSVDSPAFPIAIGSPMKDDDDDQDNQ